MATFDELKNVIVIFHNSSEGMSCPPSYHFNQGFSQSQIFSNSDL